MTNHDVLGVIGRGSANRSEIVYKCQNLIDAYDQGLLGEHALPEDLAPIHMNIEERRIYYTLPMSLNYRRNSTMLWQAAFETYEDEKLKEVFNLREASKCDLELLRSRLSARRLSLQPTRHTMNWRTISQTVHENWGSVTGLLESCSYDYLELRDTVQGIHKKGFPYLAGPKLFNYWCFILSQRCDVAFTNEEYINIAVDTHVRKASARLGVISIEDSVQMDADIIAKRWCETLSRTTIKPTSLNIPLWLWSRNGFEYNPQ